MVGSSITLCHKSEVKLLLYIGCIFIGAIAGMLIMSMLKAASDSDDLLLKEKQYEE